MHAPTDADLLQALPKLGGTVLVVGDVMVDVFGYGAAARISPEAPVPVMRLAREDRMLGGAGNVARNLVALGSAAILVAPIGCDPYADAIEALIADEAAVTARLTRCAGRRTTVKRRFIAAGQQMLRVDEEDVHPLSSADEAAMIAALRAAISQADVVILSDYGKGALTPAVLQHTIAAARKAGKPVIVDPKHRDLSRYASATCITPNSDELALGTGLPVESDGELVAAARAALVATGAEYLLATRASKGMSLVGATGNVARLSARKRAVFDVSGAGDTVVAGLAAALAGEVDWPCAAGLANAAAGVVVGKLGTATCSLDELEVELTGSMLGLGAKLQGSARAARLVAQWRGQGLRVGFTNGCFDLLHPGHVTLLQRASEACDRLVVGINSDASVTRLKGPTRPLQNQAARAAVLSALASVDLVVIFEEDTPLDLIAAIAPAVLLKGADYRLEQVVGADLVRANGGEVKLIELVEGQSTTGLIARMR